jgi:hypothetical protein
MTILPTVLDLLISTNSLNDESTAIAKYMLPEYEGQSLIRPFRPIRFGRQQWNFGVVNPGGTHLSVVSSAHPYRLVLPICEPSPYTFSWPERDPMETDTSQSWEGGQKLKGAVESKWGEDAAKWVEEAEKIGGWAIWEGRRRWGYDTIRMGCWSTIIGGIPDDKIARKCCFIWFRRIWRFSIFITI